MELSDVTRKKIRYDDEQLEEQNKPTPEQQAELDRQIVIDLYKQWQDNNGEIYDAFQFCYKLILQLKLFRLTKEDIETARAWGKSKAISVKLEKYNQFRDYIIDDEEQGKNWAKNWCVCNYFKKNGIDILINNIKAELFI
jgi:hypothetical protein